MIKPEPICSISFACLFVALTACGPQPPELDRADGASTQSALSFETEPALQSAARARRCCKRHRPRCGPEHPPPSRAGAPPPPRE